MLPPGQLVLKLQETVPKAPPFSVDIAKEGLFTDPLALTSKLGKSCTVVPETVIVTVVLCVGNVPDTVTVLLELPLADILCETVPPVSPVSDVLAAVINLFESAVSTLVTVVKAEPGVPV